MAKKKVLLMGKAHSGKTSMRSIIFANYLARDTMRLSPTLDVEHHHVRFLGDLVLNLWDCGGQDAFYESYFERDRETIFRSVEMLIYVFDIESDCPEKDFDHFAGVLEAIEENSPDARIFVLVHKMDLVDPREREAILEDRFRLIEEACAGTSLVGGSDGRHGHNANLQCFGTSIWDETLYKAWSEIVTNLIPNIGLLESHLDDFCTACDADEVVLFERATFLVISHAQASSSASSTNASTSHANASGDGGDGHLTIGSGGEKGVGASDATGAPLVVGGEQDVASVSSVGESVDPSAVADAAPQENAAADDGGGEGEEGSGTVSDGAAVVEPAPPDPASAATESSVGSEGVVGNLKQLPPMDNATEGTRADGTNGKPGERKRTPPRFDAHRFEKISNIVKQFKLSCGKTQSQFQGMEVRNSRFAAYIDAFTPNTYIMVIVSDPAVASAATLLNIRNATRHFERFIPRT